MIRIKKPADPPDVLRGKGRSIRRGLSAAYSRDPKSYESGSKVFAFDSEVYSHVTVKDALLKAQYGKCAFCESRITHVSYGDIEHFRPKAGWRQMEGEPLFRPGYYWLAYEWGNLFLSCTLCNQRFKRNMFPLQAPSTRALHHKHDLSREVPLLLDPGVDNPEAHISFRQEVPYPVGGSVRGESTIRIMGLQRDALAEQRRDRLNHVKALLKIIELGIPEAKEARELLENMQQDHAQYAAMIRAFLR